MIDKNTDHSDKFTFNENVSSCFSDMLERSIPSYREMRTLSFHIADSCCNSISVLDIGTSIGDSIYDLANKHRDCEFIGLEDSDPMILKAKDRFKDFKNVQILKHNLKNNIELNTQFGLILSILTIQFTPIEYRLQILSNIYSLLPSGGMFIFVEKVIGSSHELDSLLTHIYYNMKKENGYSQEEIQRKKMALEGVLVPVTSKWNEELLKMSGFSKVECFWRCLSFSGWVAIK